MADTLMTRREVKRLGVRVRQILNTMTYKPGWRVTLNHANANTLYFRTRCVTDDASGTVRLAKGDTMTLDMITEFHYRGVKMNDDDIKKSIDRVIEILNNHEHMEWLKFDGVHYRTPHPDPNISGS